MCPVVNSMDGPSQSFTGATVASSTGVSPCYLKRKRESVGYVNDSLKRTCAAKFKERCLTVTKRTGPRGSPRGIKPQQLVDDLQPAVTHQLDSTRQQLDKLDYTAALAAAHQMASTRKQLDKVDYAAALAECCRWLERGADAPRTRPVNAQSGAVPKPDWWDAVHEVGDETDIEILRFLEESIVEEMCRQHEAVDFFEVGVLARSVPCQPLRLTLLVLST